MLDKKTIMRRVLEKFHGRFNPETGLLREIRYGKGIYGTEVEGYVHSTRGNAEYASYVICAGMEQYYDNARRILWSLIQLQDKDESSTTFGLWPYYLEQNLKEMYLPDYNWVDFIGRTFIEILYRNPEVLGSYLEKELKKSLHKAIKCSIKRNASADYTNISLMSCFTIVSSGKLLNDNELFETGKQRLKKAYKYNKFCGSFTEYNSSCYTLVAIDEITRMIEFYHDPECRRWAKELNVIAWNMLAGHYNVNINQLAPPQCRAYSDLETGEVASMVYIGTDWKYGYLNENEARIAWFTLDIKCPEECMKKFELGTERFINQAYYKKNSIRTADEDRAILWDLDSPNLIARSYIKPDYVMGSFEISDLWAQKRTSMVVWGKENPAYFRLRGMNEDHDFCSAMAYTAQYKNITLTNIGFAVDRGDIHFNMDKTKDGTVHTRKLFFRFETGGSTHNMTIQRKGNEFIFNDGRISIKLNIVKWMFDGNEGEIHFNEADKAIELICYDGEKRVIDLKGLASTYAVFTMTVNCEESGKVVYCQKEGVLHSEFHIADRTLKVETPAVPALYNDAIKASHMSI